MQAITSNPLFFPVLLTVIIILAFPLVAGYLVLVERKVLADIQVRLGPMRVGPHGFLQPIADAVKLLIKEDIIPTDADRSIFWIAPCISCFTALTSFAVLPFTSTIRVADVNVGLLIISAMASVGILGIILGGYAAVFIMASVVTTLFLGGWLRPFPSVGWLQVPLNYGVPVLLFAGSGLLCIPMIRRLKLRWQQVFLLVLAAILILCGAIFAIPAVNDASIGVFWFLFK